MSSRMFLSSPHMGGGELELIGEVFATNYVAPTGPMVDRFESDLAQLTGFDHVAALSSGTAALLLALRLIGVGPGDEVWGASMTFIGGVAPIMYMGATPVFVDVEIDSFLIDLDLLEMALEKRESDGALPKAVITTDLYGHMPDMDRLAALRDRYGFTWISDSAESVGARRDGRHAGKGAEFAIYSFNGNKIITTSGGGALASDHEEMIRRARFLSTQAREPAPHYEHETYGYNYRLSNVCAAIGVGQLRALEDRVDARRRVNGWYREQLGDVAGMRFNEEAEGLRSNRWLTTVLVEEARAGFSAEDVRLALEEDNIESRPLWKPMHLQPVFRGCPTIRGEVAEKAFAMGLCLPSGSQMTQEDVTRVSSRILALVDQPTR